MRFLFFAVLMTAALGAPQGLDYHAHAKSVAKVFADTWKKRANVLQEQANDAETSLKRAGQTLATADMSDQDDFVAKIRAVYNASYRLGYDGGRVAAVNRLRVVMKKKPSADSAQLWLDQEVKRVQDSASAIEARLKAAHDQKVGQNGKAFGDIVRATSLAISYAGFARGTVEELQSIDEDLAAYYRAKDEQDARRRAKRTAIFGALLRGLQAAGSAYQNSLNQGLPANQTVHGGLLADQRTHSTASGCQCLCVNGEVQSVCSSTITIAPICGPRICPLTPPSIRPLSPLTLPPLGTNTCRMEQVLNELSGEYEWKQICR